MERALDFLDALRRFPRAVPVHESAGHSSIFRQLSQQHGITGDQVNDAWLAALAVEKQAGRASADRGFGRFKALRWINPLH